MSMSVLQIIYHRHQSWEKMSVWYVWENTGILMPTMSGAALFLYMAARTFFKYSIWCRKCSINMIPGRKGSGSSCCHGAALSQMLDASRGIFEKSNAAYRLGFSLSGSDGGRVPEKTIGLQLDTQSFDVEKMATFLSLHDMSNYVREPLLLELQGRRSLSVNIFDQEDT